MILSLLLFQLFATDLVFESRKLQFSNQKSLLVEVAESPDQRYRGLMHRTSLKDGHGMLFIFESPQRLNFWTKNTFIPLTIGYFDKERVLKETYDMEAQNLMAREQTPQNYPSQCHCQYALEVPQGWFKKNKIVIGSQFTLLRGSKK